ncbi:MAG: polysaccharide deacetylase family protein [Gemmatimonadales bacterium]
MTAPTSSGRLPSSTRWPRVGRRRRSSSWVDRSEAHPALTRRILAAGHEIGNHTFTHPNLALTSPWVYAAGDRRERAPARGRPRTPHRSSSGRPTSAMPSRRRPTSSCRCRSRPASATSPIGTRVDGEDWRNPGVDAIIANVMTARARGNVVLLHDGGGNRAQTVAALGPLIDSLRAAGDTLVSLGALAGLAPDVVMPRIPPGGRWTRWLEVAVFGGLAAVQWGWRAVLVAVVILGARAACCWSSGWRWCSAAAPTAPRCRSHRPRRWCR